MVECFVIVVIDRTTRKLKDWMIPKLIIDADEENKLFGYRDKRDIKVTYLKRW